MISEFQALDINLKGRTSGTMKTLCPKCSHTRKKKNDPCLSVNIDSGLYNCHNCQYSGTVVQMEKKEKKVYTVPEYNNSQVSDNTLNWFLKRGISKSTVMRFKISESKEFMPQVSANRTCINFNYFRGEKLVNIKFRDAEKNFKMVSGAELIFYGLDLIEGQKECYIVEGEMDALSLYEAGIFNVVSVPNGASKGSQKLEYLDNCWKYFEGMDRIIIGTDNDEPGRALREELARRLGKERCFVLDYDTCKDANEILMQFGKEVLNLACKERLTPWPLEGVRMVADMEGEIDDLFRNGVKPGNKIGFNKLDELITWRGGEFTVITGIPGSGKSEFTDQIMVKLANLHDWRFGVFSAENQPESFHFAKLSEKYLGRSFFSKQPYEKMTGEELSTAKAFIQERFFFVNIEENNISLDGLLEKAKQLVKQKGINGFLLDPWNYVEHKIPHGYTETQYISEALTKVCRFAKVHNVHFIIVAHPTKIGKDKEGKYNVATLYDIAGSAHWFNKADNGISVYRDFETNIVEVHIQKIRFKFIGKVGMSQFNWDYKTGRYSELNQFYKPTEIEAF